MSTPAQLPTIRVCKRREARMRGEQDHSRGTIAQARSTEAARARWMPLRNRGLQGFKFRRQHRIGPYFVDFVCPECLLAIELDGSQHLNALEYDQARSRYLEARGYRMLRFWNSDVAQRMTAVLDEVLRALRTPHPGSLREPVPLPAARGEG